MVNTTQFYKTKVALAVVLSLGLAACGDSEGDAGSTTNSNSTSDSVVEAVDNTVEHVAGTGSVQGTVLDTNGLPIMGAKVSLAGQTVETDSSGYYYFTNVPAPGVDGVNTDEGNDDDLESSGYNVTITGPAGYASAIVKVVAEDIQVDSGNNGSNDGAGDVNNAGEQTTWFDGFLAQADTAKLPSFTAAVTGVLRNCETGAALPAGVRIAADFAGLAATNTNPGNNTDVNAGVTIGIPAVTVMTGEGGRFNFDSLPIDSSLTLTVEGYTSLVNQGTATELTGIAVDTTREGIIENLGDIAVCAITSSDAVAPYISKVDSVIDNNTDDGYKWQVLSQGVDGTQGIVVRFNEALDVSAIDTDAVVVTSQVSFSNANAGEKIETVASAVVADDGLSMTITLASALPEMTKFSVWMPRYQYQDTSENRIVTGDASGTEFDSMAGDDLVFDVAGTSSGGTAAVDAVAASANVAVNVSAGLSVTADTAGAAGNTLTVTIVNAVAATAVTLDATGIVVTLDPAVETLAGVAAAITGNASAAALVDVAVNGDGATLFTTTPGSFTLAGGADAVAATPATAAGATGSSDKGVSSDTINETQFKSQYVRTRLCTYIAPITDPGEIEGEQLVKQVVAADDSIDAVGVFWDNGGSATISNLNGQHDQTEDLLQELWNRKNTNSAQTIVDNTAVITGDLLNASSIISSTGTATSGSGTWKVVVPGASHGQKVVVTPTAAFNIIGTPITVTLEDKVAPTTVIQDSYNYADSFNDDYVNSVAADAGFANGGELSQLGTSGTEGSPILYVTPRLFATDEANDDDANFNNRADVFRSLAEGNTADTNGDAYVTSNRNFVYDVNAIANWAPVSATVGVAFSENINLVTGEAVEFTVASAAPSTTLTNFVANNSQRNEDYIANDTDQDGYHTYLTHGLIQMTSNDVVGLANLDHNGVLDYTGAVSDTVNGNAALSDALVVIADAIPPLVTRAELDATSLVVTFNEPVISTSGTLKFTDPDGVEVEKSMALSAATASANNTVFTWASTVAGGLPARAAFSSTTNVNFSGELDNPNNAAPLTFNNGGAETEVVTGNFAYAETTGGSDLNHSLLTWADVSDARGNTWAEYRSFYVSTDADNVIDTQEDADPATNQWRLALQDVPVYLATDTIAAFNVGVNLSVTHDVRATPSIDDEFSVTITSSHPLLLDTDQWGGANVAAWTEAEINANFYVANTTDTVGGGCPVNTTGIDSDLSGGAPAAGDLCAVDMSAAAASWNADNTVLTISFTQAGDVIQEATTFQFRKLTNAVSADWADRQGHVVSTIVDSNGEEQSQNVQRTF